MAFTPSLMRPKATGTAGRASEKRLAGRVGGRLKPASGAMEGAKGDLETKALLIEAKATEADSLRLTLAWLTKIAGEAQDAGKLPALAVTFVTGDGRPRRDGAWVMLREADFNALMKGTEDGV